MRIVHYVDTTSLRHGGVPRFVLDVARVLQDTGHDSTILTTETTDTPEAWLAGQLGSPSVRVLDRAKLPGMLLSSAGMRAARETLRGADVLHLHCVWSMANMQLAAAARAMGLPYVVTMHGMLDDWSMEQRSFKKRAYLSLGARHMLERAAFVHSTTQVELDQSRKWFPRGRAFVVPYIVDLEPYQTLPGESIARDQHAFLNDANAPTLLFLSRLHVKKGVEHLIRASKILADRGVRHHVALAGPGDEGYVESLRRLAMEQGVADHTHFLGMVRGDHRTSLYQASDLFVLPTSQENFGIVLLESLCCNTPVVTTKGVDIWQDLQRANHGLTAQPARAASIVENGERLSSDLADVLQTQLSDRVALRACGVAGREWAMHEYAQESLIPRFERMYSLAADRRDAGVPQGSGVATVAR